MGKDPDRSQETKGSFPPLPLTLWVTLGKSHRRSALQCPCL